MSLATRVPVAEKVRRATRPEDRADARTRTELRKLSKAVGGSPPTCDDLVGQKYVMDEAVADACAPFLPRWRLALATSAAEAGAIVVHDPGLLKPRDPRPARKGGRGSKMRRRQRREGT